MATCPGPFVPIPGAAQSREQAQSSPNVTEESSEERPEGSLWRGRRVLGEALWLMPNG